MVWLRQPWFFMCGTVLLLLSCLGVGQAMAAPPLLVDGRAALPVWPAVSVLADPSDRLGIDDVLQQSQRFAPPRGVAGNLGRIPDAVWLQVPLLVPGLLPATRVLDIDYPSLNEVDVYLVRDGVVQSHQRLGNQMPYAERPLPSRAHAVALELPPGQSQLLVRVQTQGSMVLPMQLRTVPSFTAHESAMQLLHGLIFGLSLCMLVYSLTHWISLRDTAFLQYAVLLVANTVFLLSFFGIGQQYLWTDSVPIAQRIAPLAVLVAVAAGSSFLRNALALQQLSTTVCWLMRGIGWAALAVAVATAAGWLHYRDAQRWATLLGLMVVLAALPMAFLRARRGDAVAYYLLGGWTFYLAGGVAMAGLLGGHLEPGFWAQHLYPLASMVEMAAWMGVLGQRVQAIHRSADRTRVESETLRKLANTDALTGLPNRRGLQERLAHAMQSSSPQQLLAVYLLDLDGFKRVNDHHGHDVGDALLVAVGQRVQAQLRGSDVVARLGGDEFVVLASGLGDEAAARALGSKMLDAFDQPFSVAGQTCAVGLTIGYALSPLDSHNADDLLKRADAAMYAGKQAGRRRVTRGGRSTVSMA